MSALNLAIVVALGLALVGLACLLADRCRWPWMSIAEHERVLDDLTNQVLDSHAQGVEAGATSMAAMMDVKPGESIETQAARIALLLEETQAFLDQMVTQGRVQ